jgi:hypothetical protein
MAAFGLPPEAIAATEGAAEEACEIHEDNVTTAQAFFALATQWRMLPDAMAAPVILGLEYAAIPVVLDARAVPRKERPAVTAELLVMERAALHTFRDRRGHARKP